MRPIHFLCGLPRSGSTVLAAILNQNPYIHTSTTSGVASILLGALDAWRNSDAAQASTGIPDIKRILKSIIHANYSEIESNIIIDKNRAWSDATSIESLTEILGCKPKLIATVRNVADCAASFVRICKPEDQSQYLRESDHIGHLRLSYQHLYSGYNSFPDCFLFIDYDELLLDPQKQLDKIHTFLNIPPFTYDFNNIDGTSVKEKDIEIWGIDGLHDVKPILKKQHNDSSKNLLKEDFYKFKQPRFWLNEDSDDTDIHPIERMLQHGLRGEFTEAEKIGNFLTVTEPNNHRAAFNQGWYKIRKNKLLEGHKYLYRGRVEHVFGNNPPASPMPQWDGVSSGVVLLNLEGGLGDQIHGAGFVRYIVAKKCQVIIACSGQLATLFRDMPGVVSVVQHQAVFGVVHDFWVPSMSAVLNLNLEFEDINGSPYIKNLNSGPNKKLKVGLRWQGNPEFEHEQHRQFPSNLLFNAIKDMDVDYISLQRDAGSEHQPGWVKSVDLNNWERTRTAISGCDLVITSCTSVAHLAGAMGVPTWIIVPILPYYLWAKPGLTTEWYDGVRLFRQDNYQEWSSVFNNIKTELVKWVGINNNNRQTKMLKSQNNIKSNQYEVST
jgi:hypothetical protein